MPNEQMSLRDTIETAMNAGAEPVPDTAAEATPVDTAPAAEPAPSTPPVEAPPTGERPRAEDGKFAKNKPAAVKPDKAAPGPGAEKVAPPAAAKGTPAGAASPPAPAGEPAPAAPAPQPFKAPSSWKPAVRELAAKLPPEFRPILEESIRVDNEAKRALNNSTQARQLAEQVQQTLAPFEGLARANGMDSLKYAGTVMQTAAALQMGTPQQKAAVVAQLIGAYGVDVDAVNAVMQGQAPQPTQQPQPQQDVGRLVEQALQARIGQAAEAQAVSAWEAFQATEPEFLSEGIKDSMRLIIEHEAQRGRKVTYEQAYNRACQLDEEVSGVLASRKAAETVRQQAPAVQRAKVAGSSIKAAPSAAPGTRPEPAGRVGLRDAIEAAVAGQRT